MTTRGGVHVEVDPVGRGAALLDALRRHGWNATSFQLTAPGFLHFVAPEGVVGYHDTGSAWVAAGAPVTEPARLRSLALRFIEAARSAGRRATFFGVEQRFLDATGFSARPIGEQSSWVPDQWGDTLRGARSLREQLRRARAKGVRVRAVAPAELADAASPLRQRIEQLRRRWRASRRMPPMTFLVDVTPFDHVEERLHFVAERGDDLVGYLGGVPVYQRHGWFFDNLWRAPGSPNGTSELLFDAGMRAVADAGCAMVTLGMIPLSGDVGAGLRAARTLGAPLYDFDGLRAFKDKLRPAQRQPLFLAASPGESPLRALVEALRAFAGEGLVRFGLRALRRSARAGLARLAAAFTSASRGSRARCG